MEEKETQMETAHDVATAASLSRTAAPKKRVGRPRKKAAAADAAKTADAPTGRAGCPQPAAASDAMKRVPPAADNRQQTTDNQPAAVADATKRPSQ